MSYTFDREMHIEETLEANDADAMAAIEDGWDGHKEVTLHS